MNKQPLENRAMDELVIKFCHHLRKAHQDMERHFSFLTTLKITHDFTQCYVELKGTSNALVGADEMSQKTALPITELWKTENMASLAAGLINGLFLSMHRAYRWKHHQLTQPQPMVARGQSKGVSDALNKAISDIVKEAWNAGMSFNLKNSRDGRHMNPTRAMLKYLHENGWYVPEHFTASLECEEDEIDQCLRIDTERLKK